MNPEVLRSGGPGDSLNGIGLIHRRFALARAGPVRAAAVVVAAAASSSGRQKGPDRDLPLRPRSGKPVKAGLRRPRRQPR